MTLWRHDDTKNMVSKLFIALIVISNLAFLWHNFMKFHDTKIMVSKLLIALHLKTWRHKKYGVKTFYCSHCDKKFGLFCDRNVWNWRHEDTKSMVSKLLIALIVIRNSALRRIAAGDFVDELRFLWCVQMHCWSRAFYYFSLTPSN